MHRELLGTDEGADGRHGASPCRLMERSVEEEVRSALAAGGWRMRHGEPTELFAQLYAADVMATVRW